MVSTIYKVSNVYIYFNFNFFILQDLQNNYLQWAKCCMISVGLIVGGWRESTFNI